MRLGRYGFHSKEHQQNPMTRSMETNLCESNTVNGKIGSEHRSFKGVTNKHGEQRKARMIWDSIDLIMPLRGLLSLSHLDLL